MNISIACFKFKKGGGSERYVLDIINGFYQQGVKCNVYSTYFDSQLEEYKLITPKKINLSFIPKKLRLPFLSNFIKKHKQSDEVILSMSHTYNDITICGGQHKGYLRAINKRPTFIDKFKIANEQKCFEQAKLIIAHSDLMKNELVELYNIDQEKIKVIYPPVDTEKFYTISNSERDKLRKKLGFLENEIIYLFPSTGHYRKGFQELKQFFEKTDLPIKLVVVGSPIEETKNICYLGYRNDMPELYRAADFTIMASIYEPFGLVGIESILSGTPIIFSKNMACLETLNDDLNLSFIRNDKFSLENVIAQSIKYKERNKHRILEPYKILNYNPTLTNHIHKLKESIISLRNNNE
ncbi:glycosyltransferase family 4 protein [Ursidibacter sp. B-7004-1]